MKRLVNMVLALSLLALILGSCQRPAAGGGQAARTTGFRVASHNAVIEGNAYRVVYEDQMSQAVKTLQAQGLISEYATFTSNNDPAVESQQIEQTINEGYDIITVNPIAATGLDPIIDKALAAGITYVNADCEYESSKILNVVVDQREWARIQSQFVIKTLGPGKRVLHFSGLSGNSASEMRDEVWVRELTGAGLQIVRTVAHGWVDTESKRLMGEIIASGLQYDGIINQEAATGILSAIEEARVPYPGCITSSEEVAWIRRMANLNKDSLVLPFIVVENPPGIGATGLAIAINLRQGNQLKDGIASSGLMGNSIYYAPQWVMTYDNIQERLDSIKDMPDSTSVSSYMSVEQAKAAYFK
jgi:ribose transport system substrate-binding protein